MLSVRSMTTALVAFSIGLAAAPNLQPQSETLNSAGLKSMLEGLGNEVKTLNADAGKEKYEATFTSGTFNVPVAFEISPSTNYIWLTVSLGADTATKDHQELLKQNAALQPSFFYITSKGNLMMGQHIDNRRVTPVIMKRTIDKLVADVAKSATVWQKP